VRSLATDSDSEQLWAAVEDCASNILTTIRNNIIIWESIATTILLDLMNDARVVVGRWVLVVLAWVAAIRELVTGCVQQDATVESSSEARNDCIARLI
jgi:hypothetical protein